MPAAPAQPSEIPPQPEAHTRSVDAAEIARFSALAETWWNPEGPMRPLHRMNPTRIHYIRDLAQTHLTPSSSSCSSSSSSSSSPSPSPSFSSSSSSPSPLSPHTLLDIGTGGGLIAEPMARLGASVTAIDASAKNIEIAKLHAAQSGLAIDYRHTTAEALAATGAQYDIVLALEIIEHVADIPAFLDALYALVKPGGLLVLSTLNRTPKSYLFAIVGAEYVLRLLPRGTHQWRKFIKPSELAHQLRARNLALLDTTGMVMHPFTQAWSLNPTDLDVNYLISCQKS